TTGTSGSLELTLWTDSLGIPDTQIATLASISIASISSALGAGVQGLIEITDLPSVPGTQGLNANTHYWIGFQQGAADAALQSRTKPELTNTICLGEPRAFPLSVIGAGTFIEVCSASVTTDCQAFVSDPANGLTDLPVMIAQATTAEAVPEPATL